MTWGIAEFGGQKSPNEVPRDLRPDSAAADADHIHVVVLDTLRSGEMVVYQRGVRSGHLVGADRGADAAAANRDPALERFCRHRLGERDDEVRIVVVRVQRARSEIDYVVPVRPHAWREILF